jgi:hypothetical protein
MNLQSLRRSISILPRPEALSLIVRIRESRRTSKAIPKVEKQLDIPLELIEWEMRKRGIDANIDSGDPL